MSSIFSVSLVFISKLYFRRIAACFTEYILSGGMRLNMWAVAVDFKSAPCPVKNPANPAMSAILAALANPALAK